MQLSIGQRLAAGFALVLVLAACVIALSCWRLAAPAEATRQMMAAPLAKERVIADWSRNINSGVRRTMAMAKSSDGSMVKLFAEAGHDTALGFHRRLLGIAPMGGTA